MQSTIPLSILEQCQTTGYEVLEDMHRLYNHPIIQIQQSQNRQTKYLQLVNRKTANDLNESNALDESDTLHTRFQITDKAGLKRTKEDATQMLRDFDKQSSLPPPLWLRMLPVCCSIVLDGNLFTEKPILRWLAFNIDVPDKDKASALSQGTVNINSNRTEAAIDLIAPAKNLSLVFYDYLRSPNKPPTVPYYTSWGIRFRTTQDDNAEGHWIDINADVDNLRANQNSIPQLVNAQVSSPSSPFPQSIGAIAFVKGLIQQWAGMAGQRDGGALKPTRELSAYCETLQQFYPQGSWPSDGIDCVLCPSLVWSPEANVLGAAATIFWGFEGSLNQQQCSALLTLSQILMASSPLYINNPKIKEVAILRGKTDFLHKVTSHVGALIQVVEVLEENLKMAKGQSALDNPRLDCTEQAYVSGVSTMFLVAETEREYHPQPAMALEKLAGIWDKEMVEWFSRVLVWPFVRHRIVADARILAKLRAANVVLDGARAVDKVLPEISVQGSFSVTEPDDIYLFFWYALNAAMQHSAINELVHNEKARISVKYIDTGDIACIRVENTGEAPDSNRAQLGWIRDLNMIKDLTEMFAWTILWTEGQCSVYDHEHHIWVTQILQRTNAEAVSNG